MKAAIACLATLTLCAAPAFAQTTAVMPVAGQTTDTFVMAPGLTVIFEPAAGDTDGDKVRIVSVSEDPHAPVPRNPGQVALAMTFNPELGTLLEFNSGLAFDLGYRADPVKALGDIIGANATSLPTCPIKHDAVSSDQWPDSFPLITLSRFNTHPGKGC